MILTVATFITVEPRRRGVAANVGDGVLTVKSVLTNEVRRAKRNARRLFLYFARRSADNKDERRRRNALFAESGPICGSGDGKFKRKFNERGDFNE